MFIDNLGGLVEFLVRFVNSFLVPCVSWVSHFACHRIEKNRLHRFVRLAKTLMIGFWITSFGQRMKILRHLEVWWRILNRFSIDWEFEKRIRFELNRFPIDQDIRGIAQSRGEPNRFSIDQQIREATREHSNRFSIDQQIREATREHLNRFSIDQQSEWQPESIWIDSQSISKSEKQPKSIWIDSQSISNQSRTRGPMNRFSIDWGATDLQILSDGMISTIDSFKWLNPSPWYPFIHYSDQILGHFYHFLSSPSSPNRWPSFSLHFFPKTQAFSL